MFNIKSLKQEVKLDGERIVNMIEEVIVGEIKEEFEEFKASVKGTLEGFKRALSSMNDRLTNIE